MGDEKKTAAELRDERTIQAREAEQKRQEAVVDAVAKANDEELPKLGGPLLNPGLGR